MVELQAAVDKLESELAQAHNEADAHQETERNLASSLQETKAALETATAAHAEAAAEAAAQLTRVFTECNYLRAQVHTLEENTQKTEFGVAILSDDNETLREEIELAKSQVSEQSALVAQLQTRIRVLEEEVALASCKDVTAAGFQQQLQQLQQQVSALKKKRRGIPMHCLSEK